MCITKNDTETTTATTTANSRHVRSDEQNVAEDTRESSERQQQRVDDDDDLVWYFSYGSNMNPEIFEKKRKIKCVEFRVCTAPGYVLSYSESMLPYFEPGFCTCVKRSELPCSESKPDIHGVAFLITRQQYEHMLLTEGGWGYQEYRYDPLWGIGNYGEEEIECVEIEPDHGCCGDKSSTETTSTFTNSLPRRFKAMTLVGLFNDRQRYDANCSKRYYDIVNEGALSSGLPASYREYLRERHPAYEMSPCWKAKLAMRLYMVAAMPCFVLELGTLNLYVQWNERKLETRTKEQPQGTGTTTTTTNHSSDNKVQDEIEDKVSKVAAKSTNITERKRFKNVVRPPWIVMKACHVYRSIVLERMMVPFLMDWCKLPNGFRNPCCAGTTAADDYTDGVTATVTEKGH